MSSIAEESPLAEQLKSAVQAKAIEYSWTQDEDDTSLAEYIVLMVANGKTQEQIAAELSGDLLQEASGIEEFAAWLTKYVERITGAGGNDDSAQPASAQEDKLIPAAYDNDLGESAPDNAPKGPKGPKGLHGGPRGGRGGRNPVPGRGGFDAALHRTRGNDRINSHTRGAPKGPKGAKEMRGGMSGQQLQNQMMQNAQPGNPFNPISPQQQMEFMQMMEQQARMLAQFMPNMAGPGMPGAPGAPGAPQQNGQNGQNSQNGRSMFDRVERGRGGGRGRGRSASQNGSRKQSEATEGGGDSAGGDTAMESEPTSATTVQTNKKDPSSTVCYFNARCLNSACHYAHQSPAAPVGIEMDLSQNCSAGAMCEDASCNRKHPSPANNPKKKQEQQAPPEQQDCRFWPNCSNPNCHFRHPTKPLCSFGASCTNKDCKFTHLKVKCKHNPCINPRCPFQHEPGQNRNMSSFSWSKDQEQEGNNHVSDRKFVADEGQEELIRPEGNQEMAEGGPPAGEDELVN